MYRLFIGTVLGLEVQCLKVIGLRLRDHMVVVLGGVLVIFNMTLNLVAVVFSPIALADHISPLMVIAFLKWDKV